MFVPVSLADAGVINDLTAEGGRLYAATSARGVLVSRDGGKSWQGCGWNQGPAIMVFALAGEVFALSPSTGLWKSTDDGAGWSGLKPSVGGLSFTCAACPSGSIIYLGTNRGLYFSDNGGKTWKLAAGPSGVRWVDARGDRPDRLLVIFDKGELGLSKDSGKTWTKLSNDPANLRVFRSLGSNPLFFLIRSDGKIMSSPDFGTSWSALAGFSGEPRSVKCFSGCKCLGLLTSTGLYRSCDNGKTWEMLRSTEGRNNSALLVLDDGGIIIGGEGSVRRQAEVVDERMLGDVNFKTGSADLTAAAMAELDGIAAAFQQKPGLRIRVEGHTDNVGSDESNLDLSRRRAESVKNYLVSKGLSADRFDTQGYGEAYPIASNDNDAGRAKNRRVVVYLLE